MQRAPQCRCVWAGGTIGGTLGGTTGGTIGGVPPGRHDICLICYTSTFSAFLKSTQRTGGNRNIFSTKFLEYKNYNQNFYKVISYTSGDDFTQAVPAMLMTNITSTTGGIVPPEVPTGV